MDRYVRADESQVTACSYLQFVSFQVLAGSSIQGAVVVPVFGISVGSHGPDGILKAHGRAHVGRGVEAAQVVSRVDDGQEGVLPREVDPVATGMSTAARAGRRDADAYRSSIISNGGRLSNWPSPSRSPAGCASSALRGVSVGESGNQGAEPSGGLPRGRSARAPRVPGDDASVPAASGRAGWPARCLPTLLSRPSTWARGLDQHTRRRLHGDTGHGAVPSLSSSSLTFLRLKAGFLRDSGYTQSAAAFAHRLQAGFCRSPGGSSKQQANPDREYLHSESHI